MYPFYADAFHPQPRLTSATPYPPAISHTLAAPRNQLLSFDRMIEKVYADSNSKLIDTISRLRFPNLETKQQCLNFVKHLRIHRVGIPNMLNVYNQLTLNKHLFMHTYVHLVYCCEGRRQHLLVDEAKVWKEWGSVKQLTHHSLIKDKLLSFWVENTCSHHRFLYSQNFLTSEDNSDLLCHILYCGRNPDLYQLPNKPATQEYGLKESEQVIELLWMFLMQPQESSVVHRLRASIYRMARKSAYLPHDLWIARPSISNRRDLVPGANGLVTRAIMGGREVVIKKISCGDRTTRRERLEMFASEAILWKTLQHKNIVPFLGVIAEDTFDVSLVSPFFRNGNIKNHMKRYHRKEWPSLAGGWGRDLAEGLEYIHCHKPPIVHGDLKGDNVLIDDAGHARLGDFGQSYASDSGKYFDSTRVGLAVHPVHWMAPEIMEGGERVKASDKSDIYSFGCVMYEIVSGKIPFEGCSFGHVVRCVTDGKRPGVPESISRDDPLWRIIKLCWESRPELRPSAKHLVDSLTVL